MSAVFFLYNLLYRPLSMDIMLFVYETVFGNVRVWRLSPWICALICLSINLLFFLLFFQLFPNRLIWRLYGWNFRCMSWIIQKSLSDAILYQSDRLTKVIILMRENVFFQALPEGKKKKCKDNVWWKCTMSIVCKEKESQCSSYALFYSK